MYLEDLYVIPRFRRHGLGRMLLVHLANIALAIGFYKGLETKPMDEWTVFRLTGESLRKLADGG